MLFWLNVCKQSTHKGILKNVHLALHLGLVQKCKAYFSSQSIKYYYIRELKYYHM